MMEANQCCCCCWYCWYCYWHNQWVRTCVCSWRSCLLCLVGGWGWAFCASKIFVRLLQESTIGIRRTKSKKRRTKLDFVRLFCASFVLCVWL